jgi:hypothetical protein
MSVGQQEAIEAGTEEDMRANHFIPPITVQDIGPVESLSIPVHPGVIVLRGPNDSGKSELLKAVSRLAGGSEAVTCRDKAASGSIEGLGVRITVRQSARRTGELEALSIEGRLNIGDLVSPSIKDPVAADRHRIKALLQLTGVEADIKLFAGLGAAVEHATIDAIKASDLVEMAAKIKRDLESASRKQAEQADKEDAAAMGCKQAIDGIDTAIETDATLLQARLEDAIHDQGQVHAKAESAKEAIERAKQAKANLDKMSQRDRMTRGDVENREDAANGILAAAMAEVDAADAAFSEAKARLAKANEVKLSADRQIETAKETRKAWDREEELLGGWRDTIAAGAVECPSPEQIAAAEQAVTKAREAIEQAAVVRNAKAKVIEARQHFDAAKVARRESDQLREAAKATDEVLSQAVASDSLKVKNGRLITQHPDRGEVFFAERSDGTRWKLAIDEAIKRIRSLGAERTAIIPVPQAAWSELDPANKQAIHEYAVAKGVTLITAEAADGELRAEAFQSTTPAYAA